MHCDYQSNTSTNKNYQFQTFPFLDEVVSKLHWSKLCYLSKKILHHFQHPPIWQLDFPQAVLGLPLISAISAVPQHTLHQESPLLFSTNDLYELKNIDKNLIDKCSQKKQICRAKHNSDAALTLHPLRFRKEVVYFCSQNERQKMSHKSIVGMKDKRFRNPLKDPTTLGTFRTLFVNFCRKSHLQQA